MNFDMDADVQFLVNSVASGALIILIGLAARLLELRYKENKYWQYILNPELIKPKFRMLFHVQVNRYLLKHKLQKNCYSQSWFSNTENASFFAALGFGALFFISRQKSFLIVCHRISVFQKKQELCLFLKREKTKKKNDFLWFSLREREREGEKECFVQLFSYIFWSNFPL